MKPIIIKTDSNGKLIVTEEDIKKIVDDAYNEGYKDGKEYGEKNPVTITYPKGNIVYYNHDCTPIPTITCTNSYPENMTPQTITGTVNTGDCCVN